MSDPRGIYRASALERLSSPERLDTLVKITGPRTWLSLLAAAALVLGALAWGIWGRIPVTAKGRGILVRPRTIRALQAPGTGLLVSFTAREGERVKKGDVIGTIDQYELRQKLDQARQKRQELVTQRKAAVALEEKSLAFELDLLSKQRASAEKRSAELAQQLERQQKLDEAAIAQDRASIRERLKTANQLVDAARKRAEAYAQLKQSGLSRDAEVLDAERTLIESKNRVLDLEKELQQTTLREAENERQRHERLDRIDTVRDQLTECDRQEAKLKRQRLDSQSAYERELLEVDDQIASLELSLERQSKVTAECDGHVVELSAAVGQMVQHGARLGLIEEGDRSNALLCVAFIPVKDGKKTVPGVAARVEPDTVQRERFGAIVGKVREVSAFAVSAEAAVSIVGNQDVAKELLGEGSKIQVTVEPELDSSTESGYAWTSSRGPEMKVTAGTTSSVQLRLGERAPITFVLPYLKELLGL